MRITTPRREYMTTAAKGGRFHMISRPTVFKRRLLVKGSADSTIRTARLP